MSENRKEDNSVPTTHAADDAEAASSRRDFLVQGARMTAGVGIAALLGNLGHWALSYAADKEPIKIGVLHSLSGTMAISASARSRATAIPGLLKWLDQHFGKPGGAAVILVIQRLFQYAAFSGTTQRMPPRGSGTSPDRRGIK